MDTTSINNNTAVVDKKGASIGSSHVGSVQKERVPISPKVVSEISEIIKASEETPSVPTEVKEAGIEEVSDRLTLTDEHKALGIQHAGESTPVSTQPSGVVSLEEVRQELEMNPTSSGRWLGELRRKVFKFFGLWKEK